MLSDPERETLDEIERQILAEDPDLARSFQTVKPSDPYDWHWMAYTAAIHAVLAVGMILFLMGSVAGALGFATLAGGVALARHFTAPPDESEEHDPSRR